MIIIGLSFVINFPELINWNYFFMGLSFFIWGVIIEKYVLK